MFTDDEHCPNPPRKGKDGQDFEGSCMLTLLLMIAAAASIAMLLAPALIKIV